MVKEKVALGERGSLKRSPMCDVTGIAEEDFKEEVEQEEKTLTEAEKKNTSK